MKKLPLLLVGLTAFLTSCATTKNSVSDNQKNNQINVSNVFLQKSESERSFWLMYSLAMPVCVKKHIEFTMAVDLCALKYALLIGNKDNSTKIVTDLSNLSEKGLLKEYLWINLRKPWWFEPKQLDLAAYQDYLKLKPLSHQPSSNNGISFQSSDNSDVKYMLDVYSLNHPMSVPGFLFDRYQALEGESGHLLTYKYKNHPNIKVDLYIYKSLEEHSNDHSYNFANELATSVKTPIMYYSQRGVYGPVEVIDESYLTSSKLPSPISKGEYEYQSSLGESNSIFLITYSKGMIVKLRISQPIKTKVFVVDAGLLLLEAAVEQLR